MRYRFIAIQVVEKDFEAFSADHVRREAQVGQTGLLDDVLDCVHAVIADCVVGEDELLEALHLLGVRQGVHRVDAQAQTRQVESTGVAHVLLQKLFSEKLGVLHCEIKSQTLKLLPNNR